MFLSILSFDVVGLIQPRNMNYVVRSRMALRALNCLWFEASLSSCSRLVCHVVPQIGNFLSTRASPYAGV